jgi:DNA-binding NtrC family response regulator
MRRILLVEHDANNLEPMSRLLRLYGYLVRTATSVYEGRKLAHSESFDVVISDVALPDGAGVDLLNAVRSRRPAAGIAVFGQLNEQCVKDSAAAGFATCLQKPLLFAEVVRAIGQI